jgi:hypothetical protein
MRLIKSLHKSGGKIDEFDDEIFYFIIDNYNQRTLVSEITGELQLTLEPIKYEIIDEVTKNIK